MQLQQRKSGDGSIANGPEIIILHLDLGIGGAERLVVNVALNLLSLGYKVSIVTTHHDRFHCFDETRLDGLLADKITVVGDWLPRQIFGFGTALCSQIRMVYAALCILQRGVPPKLVFTDGVSTPLPLFFWAGIHSVFYCHYPDMLLCSAGSRKSMINKVYRLILDTIEEWTTACATSVFVNSYFTKETFRNTFPRLWDHSLEPIVLYPTLEDREELEDYISLPDYLCNFLGTFTEPSIANRKINMFISLNRYERKKRIELALQALALLKSGNNKGCRLLLVIAGGYDEKVQENVQYLHELQATANSLGLIWYFPSTPHILSLNTENTTEKRCGPNVDVIFRVSISSAEREALLLNSCALLYTPENEHFGIVPLEAMRSGTPVIAVNSGGPVETILNGKTGFLCDQTPESFSNAMKRLTGVGNSRGEKYLVRSSASIEMGSAGREHVLNNFTAQIMRDKLQKTIQEIFAQSNPIKKYQVIYGNKCLKALLSIVFLLVFLSLFILKVLCQSTDI